MNGKGTRPNSQQTKSRARVLLSRGLDNSTVGLIAQFSARGLRQATRNTGLDRKVIRPVLNRKKVKIVTLAKIVMGLLRNYQPFRKIDRC